MLRSFGSSSMVAFSRLSALSAATIWSALLGVPLIATVSVLPLRNPFNLIPVSMSSKARLGLSKLASPGAESPSLIVVMLITLEQLCRSYHLLAPFFL
jgi:hypothetical protein